MAVTGSADRGALRTLPELPVEDSRGLPMEMVYAPASAFAKTALVRRGFAPCSASSRYVSVGSALRWQDSLLGSVLGSVVVILVVEMASQSSALPCPIQRDE